MSANLKDPQGNPASVEGASPYDTYREECVAVISEVGIAHVRCAGEGIRAILSVLKQREDDMDGDGAGLKLSTVTTSGLLSALAVCADFMEQNATGDAVVHTRRFDCDTTDHWRVFHTAGEATMPKRPAPGSAKK